MKPFRGNAIRASPDKGDRTSIAERVSGPPKSQPLGTRRPLGKTGPQLGDRSEKKGQAAGQKIRGKLRGKLGTGPE
jgi:hypothetical protein